MPLKITLYIIYNHARRGLDTESTIDADDPAYRYQVHVGFDDDDPFWSRPTKLARARALGAEKTAGLPVTLNFTTYSGMKGAPCHVWSALQQQGGKGNDAVKGALIGGIAGHMLNKQGKGGGILGG